jgi:triosephosphate isomerase
MKLIANFKQNFSEQEFLNYLDAIIPYLEGFKNKPGNSLILAPSHPYLSLLKHRVNKFKFISIAGQDVSKFPRGSHTGEVGAFQLKNFCDYCIVGHSERRSKLKESISDINLKITSLGEEGIKPIVCVSSIEHITELPNLSKVEVALEPVEFIGGKTSAPNDYIRAFYKQSCLQSGIIYGGSVNSENVVDLLQLDFLKGFLVGNASLDPKEFIKLYTHL